MLPPRTGAHNPPDQHGEAKNGAPRSEVFLPGKPQDGAEHTSNTSRGSVPMFGRQRQPKGEPLERIDARVKPATAAWLRKMAGDSSLGILLDHLAGHSDGTK